MTEITPPKTQKNPRCQLYLEKNTTLIEKKVREPEQKITNARYTVIMKSTKGNWQNVHKGHIKIVMNKKLLRDDHLTRQANMKEFLSLQIHNPTLDFQ